MDSDTDSEQTTFRFRIRTCNTQKQLNQVLQQESLELQQKAIISSPQLEEKLKSDQAEIDASNIL